MGSPLPRLPGLFGVTPPHGALSVVSVCCLPFLPECRLYEGEDFTVSSAKSPVPRILLGASWVLCKHLLTE